MIVALGDRDLAYLTHREVDAALRLFPPGLERRVVDRQSPRRRVARRATGVWRCPGTPYRDDGTAYAAIRHCLDNGMPFLGACGGFQHALIELAGGRAGVVDAAHAESDPDAPAPVISRLAHAASPGESRTVAQPGTAFRRDLRQRAVRGLPPLWLRAQVSPPASGPLERAGVIVGATRPDAGIEAIWARPPLLPRDSVPAPGRRERDRPGPLLNAFVAVTTA